MRPLEVLLTLINLATFLALAFPRLRTLRATRFIPFGALLAAAAQIVSEGARWQMAPAYAVSVLLLTLHEGSGSARLHLAHCRFR
jgi:hypothetical protein